MRRRRRWRRIMKVRQSVLEGVFVVVALIV
jgi:hypothetical protein